MKFLLTGVETENKGAELMLYAILQEIERKFPQSEVYLHESQVKQGIEYIKTKLNLMLLKTAFQHKIAKKLHLNWIFRKLHIKFRFVDTYYIKDFDYVIDGNGFHFTDKFNLNEIDVLFWKKMLSRQKKKGSKIVFLPQAFGPIKKTNTCAEIKSISDNADIIYARESVSYDFLEKSGIVDMSKVKIYPDFTSLVEGVFPEQLEHLRGAVCIIPNCQMVRMGILTKQKYIDFIVKIVSISKDFNRKVYLLNHEGIGDENLAYECQKKLNDIDVVTKLNALETKGLISSAYLVITSRFHGVASALNTGVPCLATSWSHKYACLFADYGQNDCVLTLTDEDADNAKIKDYLNSDINAQIRMQLKQQLPIIKEKTTNMWNEVWNL